LIEKCNKNKIRWIGTLSNNNNFLLDQELIKEEQNLERILDEARLSFAEVEGLKQKIININSSEEFKENAFITKEDINKYYRNEVSNSSLILIHAPTKEFEITIPEAGELSSFLENMKVDPTSPEFEEIEELKKSKYVMFVKGDSSSMTLYYVSDQNEVDNHEREDFDKILQSIVMFYSEKTIPSSDTNK